MTETIDKVVERVSEGRNLLGNLALIDVNTWETSQEVYKAWQSGVAVKGVNTANLAVYRFVDGKVVFNLLGHEGNPFVEERFRKDVYNGILLNEFFMPQGEMKEHVMAAINAGQSVEINYSGLNTKTEDCSESYCFIEFNGNNPDEEKRLFSGVYGVENIEDGKRIYLLRENIVKQQLDERPDDLVVRACYLNSYRNFNAGDRLINYHYSAVRGVLLDSAEGGAQDDKQTKEGIDKPLIVDPSLKKAYLALKVGAESFSAPNGIYKLHK